MVRQKVDEDEADTGQELVTKALKVIDTKCIATKTQKMNPTYAKVLELEVHNR